MCLGLHYAEQRGEEDPERWVFYFVQHHIPGIPVLISTGVAIARTDFDHRCEGDTRGDNYIVGPIDWVLYAERFEDEGEEASERYLPCTLHQNGEIIIVRDTADLGWHRWYVDGARVVDSLLREGT